MGRRYDDRLAQIGSDWEPVPSERELARETLPTFVRADEMGLAEGSLYLGRALLELKKLDRAEAALRRALDRGHTRAPYWLANALTRRRPPDWVGAEQVQRQAVERGLPNHAGLAECLEHLGDTDGADRAWRQAAEHEPITDNGLYWKRTWAQSRAARYREGLRRREQRARDQ